MVISVATIFLAMYHQKTNWIRVRRDTRCPICGRADWCLISPDEDACICARIESDKRCGDAGWLHRISERVYLPSQLIAPAKPDCNIDWTKRDQGFHENMNGLAWQKLSTDLGICIATLQQMGWGWSAVHQCWTVPMRNGAGEIIGIRTRHLDGSKRAVPGSKSGLFFVPESIRGSTLIICEGPTDSAALIELGFDGVVGRPSCRGGTAHLLDLIRRTAIPSAIVIPDNDNLVSVARNP